MIKKLKTKFIVSIMLSITLIFIFFTIGLNVMIVQINEKETQDLLHEIVDSDGECLIEQPEYSTIVNNSDMGEIISGQMNYYNTSFAIKINHMNEITSMMTRYNDIDLVGYILKEVTTKVNEGETEGSFSNFSFLVKNKHYGRIIAVADNSGESFFSRMIIKNSITIGFISLIGIMILAIFLSAWAVKPIKVAFKKQQEFISDASHELKTPLAIISANAEVLKTKMGENKWATFIVEETKHMNELVNDMLTLAKIDENKELAFSKFNLSDAVLSAALPFESISFENEKHLNIEVEKEINFVGMESKIKQLLIILLDNAMKHTQKDGKISVKLEQNDDKIKLQVSNEGKEIPKEEISLLFDRFYRSDTSRNSTNGGSGLGLAIAKAIAESHNGKITIECENGNINFIVRL